MRSERGSTGMTKNMTFAVEGEIMVVLHTTSPPSESEWTKWMEALRRIPVHRLKMLVFSDGGAPDTLQRGVFIDHLGSAQPPIAVVSNALAIRGVVTAISWFNRQVKLFSPAQLPAAFAHLGVSPDQGRGLLSVAQRATAELGTILAAFKASPP